MTEVINLIAVTHGTDDYGDPVDTETVRQVFAEQMSIGQAEFYQAQASGLKPELKFKLADYYDFKDEPFMEYNGKRYKLLRTFRTGNSLELTYSKEVNRT